jgi:uncharacterized protein (UPF0248 family)
MVALDRLLHRIKWDREFGSGEFALGYYDRVIGQETLVSLSSITFDRQRPDTFTFTDEDGVARHIPLHRVRSVYRDGRIIWSRAREPARQRQSSRRK